MNPYKYLMTLRRKTEIPAVRVVLCALVFACSVAMVVVYVWGGSIWESQEPNQETALSQKPTRPILISNTRSISFDEHRESGLDVSFGDAHSWDENSVQDQEEAMSIALAGRLCFPPAVSIALRQMIDEPVNDRLDTMLHVACQNGDLTTICFLIDAGADLNVTNRFGETPLDLVDYKQRDYVEGITRTIEHRRPQLPECSDSETHRG